MRNEIMKDCSGSQGSSLPDHNPNPDYKYAKNVDISYRQDNI